MAAKTYRLRIVQDGKEFEAEGDKSFVLDMLRIHGPQAPSQRSTTSESGKKSHLKESPQLRPTSGKSLSIREFIQQFELKKHTDISLAFGYYLEKHQGLAEFTPADINNCYYEAKLEVSNTSQMIIQNIKRGYLMASKKKDGGKNRYLLTSSGERFVESKLPRSS